MNSAEELSKYSDHISHYRSPTLARRTSEQEEPQPDKPAKKDKKWSLGGLFRRRKKSVETESTSDEESTQKKGFLQRRKQKKEEKRKKRTNKPIGHFDHIVVTPSYLQNGKEEEIFSEPTTRRAISNDRSRESLNKTRPDLNLSRGSLGSISLDSTGKKSRREKFKARAEALRDRIKNESSSDEGSQRSTTSSMARFKSDDSLSRKDGTHRKSRAARTERYNRRLTKEEENVLNKEAEQKSTTAQINRWHVVDEVSKSPPKAKLGYSPSVPLPQKPYPISTIPPAIHRTSSNLSDNQRHYFNSSHKVVYPAGRNQNQHLQRSFNNKRNDFQEQRSYSYDCNINRSPTPVRDEDIIHVHFPLGKPIPKQRNINLINNNNYSNQSLQRITPPTPPPRDPQRRMYPVQYENSRPMSYAFENGNQQKPNQSSSNLRTYNQTRTPNLGWQPNYRSNSEDHIAQPITQVQLLNRPASATPDTPQQRFIRRHPDQYKYFAEKTPRSRKPITIAPQPDQTYLSDSQVITRPYHAPRHPVHAASEFWRQKDLEETRRKSQLFEPKCSPPKKPEAAKKNFAVLSVPVKTADSLSSLSGNSDISSKFVETSDLRPLSMVLETQENQEIPKNIPNLQKYSRQSSASSNENSEEKSKRKSSNLEDALDELEAIYKSLRLGDEDLLERAEERDVPSGVSQKLFPRDAQSDSGYNYDAVDGIKTKRLSRRSGIPDKVNDDMAYRRLNRDRPPPLDINAAVSQVSYLLASPVLGSASYDENDSESNSKEPDIVLDDVVFRNIKHTNNTLKISDPQPPFGIPVGPITGSANSDYLHAVPDERARSRFIPQKSPDIVKDDLAYRSWRKDGTDDVFNNNNNNKVEPAKKRRAVRSISANIYNLMHRDQSRPDYSSENEFEKAQSLTDIADAMEIARQILKDRQNKFYPKSTEVDTKLKQNTSTETLAENNLQQKLQIYIPLTTNEVNLNQKPPLCPTPDRKSSKSATKESTPNRVSPNLLENQLDNNHLEDLLTKLAIEARETSEKLGNDLKLLDEEESRKCSPRLSVSNSPAPLLEPNFVQKTDELPKTYSPIPDNTEFNSTPIEERKVLRKNLNEHLSDIETVSEHAKLCEKLLECVVESTNLIGHTLPDINLNQQVNELDEPQIFKSFANVVVTRKSDSPVIIETRPEIHSESSDHDYENIDQDLEETTCKSPFEEHREQILADFEVLKNDLYSDEFKVVPTPRTEDDTFEKLQQEPCSGEGEVCNNSLASKTNADLNDFLIINPPAAYYFPRDKQNFHSNLRDDSEHSSGFQSHGSSSADSSLNAILYDEPADDLFVSNSSIVFNLIPSNSGQTEIINVPEEFADFSNHSEVDNSQTIPILNQNDSEFNFNTSSVDDTSKLSVETPVVLQDNNEEIVSSSDTFENIPSTPNISDSLTSITDDQNTSDTLENIPSNLNDSNSSVSTSLQTDDEDKLMTSPSDSLQIDDKDEFAFPDSLENISSYSITDNFSTTSIDDNAELLYSENSEISSAIISDSVSSINNVEDEILDSSSSSFKVPEELCSELSYSCSQSNSNYVQPYTGVLSDSEDTYLDSVRPWYRDPTTIALACSYSIAFAHQLALIDIVTLLGIVLAIISVFAALIL